MSTQAAAELDFDLRAHTHILTLSGSRAYGLHTPESDVDIKGVAVPPARYFHGCMYSFEQADGPEGIQRFLPELTPAEQVVSQRIKLEGTIYELRKFLKLAAAANPNILEVLFCRDQEVRLISPVGERLRAARGLFLSQRAKHTFSGYAASQLKRIKLHRRWLLDPPRQEPLRADYGLPEQTLIPADQLAAAVAAVKKKMDSWEIDFGELSPAGVIQIQGQLERFLSELQLSDDERFGGAARLIGMDENLILALQKEREYHSARREWEQHQDWKKNRNPARAALEVKYGFDVKHAMHLVRLLHMCREILESGEVHVWRGGRDADLLLAIRGGAWSYEQLVEWAEAEDRALEELARSERCAVPRSPDTARIDQLCVELVEESLSRGGP